MAGDLPSGAGGEAARVIGCDNPWLEAEAAARWCDDELRRDSRARLLLVVPKAGAAASPVGARADAAAGFCGAARRRYQCGDSPFAIEGGQALEAYPLVAAALQLIAIAQRAGGL
jgi:hypothetical protein